MVEASQTSVSAAGIWAIVIVMVLVLAFWLTAIVLADRSQARASGRARLAGDTRLASDTGPALTGTWAGGSVAGARAPEIPEEAAHEPILAPADAQGADAQGAEARGRHARDEEAETTREDIPAQRTPGRHQRSEMPRQRGGEADRAERSYTGQAPPDDEERDR